SKSLPDTPTGVHAAELPDGGVKNSTKRSPAMPRRSPPPPTFKEPAGTVSWPSVTAKADGGGSSMGAFLDYQACLVAKA
ncbi:hypothetical protein FRX31_031515, partial [Thalictrum thalictroides]